MKKNVKGQYTMLNDKQKVFVDILKKEYPDAVEVRRGDLNTIHKKNSVSLAHQKKSNFSPSHAQTSHTNKYILKKIEYDLVEIST
mgnify:CR=1 FL=1